MEVGGPIGPGLDDGCISGNVLSSGLNVPLPRVLSLVGGPQTFLDDACCGACEAQALNRSELGADAFCHDCELLLSCEVWWEVEVEGGIKLEWTPFRRRS